MVRWGAGVLGAVAVVVTTLGAGAAPSAAQDDAGLVYVSLGDSYTSGPLVLPHDTRWVPQGCGQSIRNYPHLAALRLGASSFTDVSCGGATIDDLYEPQTGLPDGSTNAPQLEALGPDVDVVTIGIGGNDVGFVGLALGCIRLVGPPTEQPCTPTYTGGGQDLVSDQIAEVAPELGQALDDIHAAAPDAEVFVVGYPTSLPDDAVACWPYVPILQADMPYLVAKYKQMNAMLAEQAARHDATYIDIYAPSIGHDACKPPAIAWVNGVVVVPPSYPAHPNELGLAASSVVVADAIRARLAEEPPEGAAAPAPEPSGAPLPAPARSSAPTGPTGPIAEGRALPATGGEGATAAALAALVAGLAVRSLVRPRRSA